MNFDLSTLMKEADGLSLIFIDLYISELTPRLHHVRPLTSLLRT